ncbi:uncharacterized protein LOC129572287 [Sitodiplosis mosellana]|uniref:uncharacterized protein LOC129572287 n=1 Tax=Sitodiplosis mosellana TaxID=263140 RepID=UPI0024445EA3|nr:uncharacterized protein LOC129572287 [Sitodiplosis mosellana]
MHTIKINVTTRQIVESLLKVVTIRGKPLVDLNNFQVLLAPYFNALKTCGLQITSRNIHGYIKATAAVIRKKISAELKDEMFNIMVDIATKNKRSILGVNTSCVINDQTVIRTISMEEITHRHTSENIVDDIIKLLEEGFGLAPDQVFSFIADNAFNMSKAGRLLDEAADDDTSEGVETNVPSQEDDEDEPRMLTEDEFEDAILNMLTDCQYYADLISNVAEKYAARNKDIHIKSTNTIGCASHSLHLAVEKGIKSTATVKNCITAARDLVKQLRTPTILTRIRTETSHKLPQIDVPTRWNSKYIMLKSIWELKPFVQQLAEEDAKYGFYHWDQLRSIIDVLVIAYVPSIKLQAVKCTLTDMWALWNMLQIQLRRNTTPLAKNILKCLDEREHVIKNPSVFAAIFLDPRYKSILNQGEQQVALCELIALHSKLQKKKPNDQQNDREMDELEVLLMAADLDADEGDENQEMDPSASDSPIQDEIQRFKKVRRIDREVEILAYWKNNKGKFPLLYELAKVLFAVPNGQTSVERGFSSLDFIYDRRRCNLSPDILNDILIIRLNSSLLEELDDVDWDEILAKQIPNE